MLLLGRKLGQKILIGDDIVITIAEISGTIVKIGIDAPKEVVILREEIKDKPKKAPTTLANGS